MADEGNPFSVRDGEVLWKHTPLTPREAANLLANFTAKPGNYPPGRADQLRAAMAEAYQQQEAA